MTIASILKPRAIGSKEIRYPEVDCSDPLVGRVVDHATRVHAGEFRCDGKPFTSHLLETLRILQILGFDHEIQAASFGHDIAEHDRRLDRRELMRLIGNERVVNLILSVTVSSDPNAKRWIGWNLYLSALQDYGCIPLKGADNNHNMKTLEYLEPKKRLECALRTAAQYRIWYPLWMTIDMPTTFNQPICDLWDENICLADNAIYRLSKGEIPDALAQLEAAVEQSMSDFEMLIGRYPHFLPDLTLRNFRRA